ASLVSSSPYLLDRFCDSDNTNCFIVQQSYGVIGSRRFARREMNWELDDQTTQTTLNLEWPEIVTAYDLVHEHWRVAHA
ncbi:hypothetical protein PENTCL1PPCAC_20939, partial [Pristionchus entomophagus]